MYPERNITEAEEQSVNPSPCSVHTSSENQRGVKTLGSATRLISANF